MMICVRHCVHHPYYIYYVYFAMRDLYDPSSVVASHSGVSAQRGGHCSQRCQNISDINDSTNYGKEWKAIGNVQYVMHIILGRERLPRHRRHIYQAIRWCPLLWPCLFCRQKRVHMCHIKYGFIWPEMEGLVTIIAECIRLGVGNWPSATGDVCLQPGPVCPIQRVGVGYLNNCWKHLYSRLRCKEVLRLAKHN